MIPPKPIRILEVVGGMTRGGIETWLMHVLRHIDRACFHLDFLVHTAEPCAYDDEIRSLGSKIIPCLQPSRPWSYAGHFKRIVREHGPYEVVHSHVHHYSGFVLRLARQAGVPVRIAHSHLDYSGGHESSVFRQMYCWLMNRWLDRNVTVGLAASRPAGKALFGSSWEQKSAHRLLYYGVDFSSFHEADSPAEMRRTLGIPPAAFVIGHAGRMVEQKNHRFLIEIFAQVARRDANAVLLLVGDGPLRSAIEQQVRDAGLSARVIFAGVRPDVPRLMRGVMDLFLLPSLFEGLPLVGIEAQAAGLPTVVSDAITSELDVIPALVRRFTLAEPASAWADGVLALRAIKRGVTRDEALTLMENSPFTIQRSTAELEQIYACHA